MQRRHSLRTCTLLLFTLTSASPNLARAAPPTAAAVVPYGANKAAAGSFVHDGVTLYYETYGNGEPLLLIHGNGGSIGWLAAQIEYFKTHRHVIVMDSRDQGRSGDSLGPLTYEKLTDDQAALLDHLRIESTDIVGWSDGAIQALLMGLRHPTKVRKLVAMAANLTPAAIYPETEQFAQAMQASIPASARETPEGRRALKGVTMLLTEPHIDLSLLKKITAPTLVLSSDHDLIRLDHTVAIYEALPNAELAVCPNSTHFVPYDDPTTFNDVVEHFLTAPFKPKRRVADVMRSAERLSSGLAK